MSDADEDNIVIGIDLGTTNSCVAVFYVDRQVIEILPNAAGSNITPSWVAYEKGVNHAIVGKAAATRENYYHHTKRVIGQSYSEITKNQAMVNSLPFSLRQGDNDRAEIASYEDGGALAPEQIAGSILKEMREIAEKRVGMKVTKAAVTVPAYFNASQRDATIKAGVIAGLDVQRIINEPTAAGMACNFHLVTDESERMVVVYDFGGGTLDISIMSVSEGTLDVQSTKGDSLLGGLDLDKVILERCEDKIQSELTYKSGGAPQDGDIVPPALQKLLRRRLRLECERAKIELSTAYEATIIVEKIICDHEVYNDLDFNMIITRDEFEEAAKDIFEKIRVPLDKALENADVSPDEVQDVVLMGGSTRIPFVQKMLREYFPSSNMYDKVSADEGVARGAAMMSAQLAGLLRGANDSFESLPDEAESSEEDSRASAVLEPARDTDQDHQVQGPPSEVEPPKPKKQKQKSERPKLKPVVVSDVLPQSLGTDVMRRQEDGTKIVISDKLLKACATMPVSNDRTYRTIKDNQKRVSVEVLQGDEFLAKDCHLVGKFWLEGIPEAPKGQQKVKVTFSIDASGVCTVSATAVDNANNVKVLKIDSQTLGLTDDRLIRLQQQNQATRHLHDSDSSSDEAD